MQGTQPVPLVLRVGVEHAYDYRASPAEVDSLRRRAQVGAKKRLRTDRPLRGVADVIAQAQAQGRTRNRPHPTPLPPP